MASKRPTVSLVIPAYNEERQIRACLRAVARQTVQPLEVVVVDNNSTDRTAALAAGYELVRVIQEPRQGIVFARDAGFNAAKGEVIARIDADVLLPASWIASVQQFYANPRHHNQVLTGSGLFYDLRFPRLFSWFYRLVGFHVNRLFLSHYTLWGSNLALLRTQWQLVASEACRRVDIHEDLDLAMHMAQHGQQIYFDRKLVTAAQLRPGRANRFPLWEQLQWWPRTYRVHGHRSWVVIWFFFTLVVYCFSPLYVLAATPKRRPRQTSAIRNYSSESSAVDF